MTGSPLLRLLLVLAGLGLLAIPAWHLTGRETPAAIAPPALENKPGSVAEVQLTFTSPIPPSRITVEAEGSKLVTCDPQTSVTTAKAPLQRAIDGNDLVVKASWPDASPKDNALRVQVAVDGNPLSDTTLWGSPNVEDVITLPGAPAP